MLARDIMSDGVISVTPHHSVRHAAQIMLDHHVSGLPVIDDEGHLVGMLSEGDLLRRAELGFSATPRTEGNSADYLKSQSWRVGDVMTANKDTSAASSSSITTAAHTTTPTRQPLLFR
eukprot:gene36725-49509_t